MLNLLDLVITDVASKTWVGGKIQDHAYVIIENNFALPRAARTKRNVWNYSKADWDRLRDNLQDQDWNVLRSLGPDEGTAALTDKVLEFAEECIGRKQVKEMKCTHPWMTAEVIKCVADKHAANGTSEEKYRTELCI